jgi:HK97 family phage portal protein
MPWQWPWTPRTQDRALFNIGDAPAVQSWAGVSVTPDRALRLSTVWGCVRLLSDSVSTLPLQVFRDDERDPLPTPRLLARPSADHPELSDWLWAVMASLLLRGNAWGMISDRAGAGLLPAQVDLLDPDRVGVQEDRDAPPVIRVDGAEVDRAELWHVKAYPVAGSILGMSPIAYARESIGLGLAAERFGAQFFGEGAVPTGVIESDDARLKQEGADRLMAMWMMRHRGHHKPAILAGAKYRNITIAPEEAQFVETQKFNVSTICRFFGVPAGMMAGSELAGHEDYSSPEMRSVDFLQYTLRPWLHRLERAISSQLLPRTQRAKFNAGAILRPTLRERYEAHRLGIEAGWLLRSEVRELEDRPPVAGIDDQPEAPTSGGGAVA